MLLNGFLHIFNRNIPRKFNFCLFPGTAHARTYDAIHFLQAAFYEHFTTWAMHAPDPENLLHFNTSCFVFSETPFIFMVKLVSIHLAKDSYFKHYQVGIAKILFPYCSTFLKLRNQTGYFYLAVP